MVGRIFWGAGGGGGGAVMGGGGGGRGAGFENYGTDNSHDVIQRLVVRVLR